MTETGDELLATPRPPRVALFALFVVLALGTGLGVAAVAHGHSRHPASHPRSSAGGTAVNPAPPVTSPAVASAAVVPGNGWTENVDQHAVTLSAEIRSIATRTLVLSGPIAVLDRQGRPVASASAELASKQGDPLTELQPRQAALLVMRFVCGPDQRWRSRDVERLRIVITWQGYPAPATYEVNEWFRGFTSDGCP